MLQVVKVKPLPGYRLWLEYSDGVRGEVDLSDLARHDIYKAWKKPGFFEKVHIDHAYDGAVVWDETVEVDTYDLYMTITGKAWEELPIEVQMTGNPNTLKVKDVKSLPGYRIWVEFNNGVCGEIDLSHLVGKPVFKAWDEPGYFEKAHVEHGTVVWDENIDLCEYALYMEITGKSWEELPGHVISNDNEAMTYDA